MTTVNSPSITRTPLHPFGEVVTAPDGNADLRAIAPSTLEEWTVAAKVLVLRGFPLLAKEDLVAYCEGWGDVLKWDFGEVLDLVVMDEPKNYLFSRTDVPFHWDGAFAKVAPRFFLFQCVQAPEAGGGGETVFSDTTEVIRRAGDDVRNRWQQVNVTYRTDKLAYYGGQATAPLLATHSRTGETIMRYGEPLDPERYQNPVFLTMSGIAAQEAGPLMSDLRERLHDPEVCYAHEWHDGDIVVVDNEALLHGRNAFRGDASRHLQRIQIL
jgi:alpha-ketoglutarate-dependent taurine dioxygenase